MQEALDPLRVCVLMVCEGGSYDMKESFSTLCRNGT